MRVTIARTRVVSGRRLRHDAADRSRRLLAANKRELTQAEVIAGIIHHGVEHHTDPLPRPSRPGTPARPASSPGPTPPSGPPPPT
jgi:hypothetical protein